MVKSITDTSFPSRLYDDCEAQNLREHNRINEIFCSFRSQNKSSVVDGLHKLWKYIEGVMLHESKPLRLVIGKLGKMGHGEFKGE